MAFEWNLWISRAFSTQTIRIESAGETFGGCAARAIKLASKTLSSNFPADSGNLRGIWSLLKFNENIFGKYHLLNSIYKYCLLNAPQNF